MPAFAPRAVSAPILFTEDPAPPKEIYSFGRTTQLLLGGGVYNRDQRRSFLRLQSGNSEEIKNFIHGREVMRHFRNHDAILQIYDIKDQPGAGVYTLICEPIQSTLAQLLQRLRSSYNGDKAFYNNFFAEGSENNFVSWAKSLTSGLSYLHNNGLIHATLSSNTIWVANAANEEGSIFRIGDFTHATQVDRVIYHADPRGFLRTLDTGPELDVRAMRTPLAPEILTYGNYSQATDIFSLGIVLWEMLTVKSAKQTVKLKSSEIKRGYKGCLMNNELRLLLPFPKAAPEWIVELISSCWKPIGRPSADMIHDVILQNCNQR